MLGYILSAMIDLFNAAFGITVGMVWSKSTRAGMAMLGITVVLLGLMHYAAGIWAWITFSLAKVRQKADAATKEQQTLKP